MWDAIKAALTGNPANVCLVAGLGFLFIAVLGKVTGIVVDKPGRIVAGGSGAVLLLLGISVNLWSAHSTITLRQAVPPVVSANPPQLEKPLLQASKSPTKPPRPPNPCDRYSNASRLAKAGKNNEAAEEYEKALDRWGQNCGGDDESSAYKNLGYVQLERQQFNYAFDNFVAALRPIPESTGEPRDAKSIYVGLARALTQLGESQAAAVAQALGEDPTLGCQHYYLANGLADPKAKLQELRRAVANLDNSQCTSKFIFKDLGMTLAEQNHLTEAITYLRLAPDDPTAQYELGWVYERNQPPDFNEALRHYKEANNQEPGNSQFRHSCERVAKLINTNCD